MSGSHPSLRQQMLRMDRRWASAVSLLIGFAFATPLLRGHSFHGMDLSLSSLGLSCALRANLQQGLGLWISPLLGGQGLLALRPAAMVFYPSTWLLLGLPAELATSVHVIVHLSLASAFAYVLARSFRVRPQIAVAAALAYALSGPISNLILHGNYIVDATWLPLVWAAARRGRAPQRRWFWALIASLGLALLLLGGEPQGFAIGVALVLLVSFHRRHALSSQAMHALRSAAPMIVAIAAAVLVGAALWLPVWMEMQLGLRSSTLDMQRVLRWSFDPSLWPASLLGDPFFADGTWALVRDQHSDSLWINAPYIGVLWMSLCVVGLSLRRAACARWVLAVGLIAALGASTPLFPTALKIIPGLALFRFPVKYLIVTTLAAMIVAAVALNQARRQAHVRRRLVLALSSMTASLALVILVLLSARWSLPAPPPSLGAESRALGLDSIIDAVLFSCLLALAVALPSSLAAHKSKTLLLLPLLWTGDLAQVALRTLDTGPALSSLPSPLARLGDNATLCFSGDLYNGRFGGLGQSAAWSRSASWKIFALPELQACQGLRAAVPYAPLATRVQHELYYRQAKIGSATARSLGCDTLLSATHQDNDPGLKELPWSALGLSLPPSAPKVYRVVDPVAALTVVDTPEQINEPELMRRIPQCATMGCALSLVDDPLGRWPGVRFPSQPSLRILAARWEGSDRFVLNADGSGVLVLRSAYLAGWHARRGDQALPLLRAAGQHLAVVIGVGGGDVILEYDAPMAKLAALLSAMGVAIWIVMIRTGRRGLPRGQS